jgi:deoxyribodipyrimidine photo-lyase
MTRVSVVWFRNDLRLHDNEALHQAVQHSDSIVPVYVFDKRIFHGQTSFGFEKTGIFRRNFLIESVLDLRAQLRQLGSDLIIREGFPEEEVFKIAQEVKSGWVFCNRERTSEEVLVQNRLEKNLWTIGQELRYVRGKMLFHTSDLPFPVSHVPDVFTAFRKSVENVVPVRKPLDIPVLKPLPETVNLNDGSFTPILRQHEITEKNHELNRFIGGETAGLKQLQYYLWDTDLVSSYKQSRNGMVGWEYSSKFSPWLASGCLSPKKIVEEINRYEQTRTKNESTYWLFFELMWRDFFRLMGKKYGNNIFKIEGPAEKKKYYSTDIEAFNQWKDGQTGIPFIDAAMRELNQTGFMSNRARQNVASFLVKDLGISWVMGAEYFESLLVDYDPCSNYGNWNYIAGVGNDPRENRYFNILSQARNYDPEGKFIRTWIDALKYVPDRYIHQPHLMDLTTQASAGVIIGRDYPHPVIDTHKWAG